MRHHHRHHGSDAGRGRHARPASEQGEFRERGQARRDGEQTAAEGGRKRFAGFEASQAGPANADVAASAAPLSRAIHNLNSAIDGRLADGGPERAIILDVAGLIDQAASRIERL